jgi:hypothetical protein
MSEEAKRPDGYTKGNARVEALHDALLSEFGINQQSNGRLLRILAAIDAAEAKSLGSYLDGIVNSKDRALIRDVIGEWHFQRQRSLPS